MKNRLIIYFYSYWFPQIQKKLQRIIQTKYSLNYLIIIILKPSRCHIYHLHSVTFSPKIIASSSDPPITYSKSGRIIHLDIFAVPFSRRHGEIAWQVTLPTTLGLDREINIWQRNVTNNPVGSHRIHYRPFVPATWTALDHSWIVTESEKRGAQSPAPPPGGSANTYLTAVPRLQPESRSGQVRDRFTTRSVAPGAPTFSSWQR